MVVDGRPRSRFAPRRHADVRRLSGRRRCGSFERSRQRTGPSEAADWAGILPVAVRRHGGRRRALRLSDAAATSVARILRVSAIGVGGCGDRGGFQLGDGGLRQFNLSDWTALRPVQSYSLPHYSRPSCSDNCQHTLLILARFKISLVYPQYANKAYFHIQYSYLSVSSVVCLHNVRTDFDEIWRGRCHLALVEHVQSCRQLQIHLSSNNKILVDPSNSTQSVLSYRFGHIFCVLRSKRRTVRAFYRTVFFSSVAFVSFFCTEFVLSVVRCLSPRLRMNF